LSSNEKFIKRDLGDLKFFGYRNKIGKVSFDLRNLHRDIECLLLKKPIYKLRITQLRDKLIYNIGKSESFLLNLINKEDWLENFRKSYKALLFE